MQTPASVYVASPRIYPGRARQPEYESLMRVRRIQQQQGQFRWKSERVFLTTVLEGERVGLLASDERYFVVYFAEFPIALFDSRELKILPLTQGKDFDSDEAGEREEKNAVNPRRSVSGLKCQGSPRLLIPIQSYISIWSPRHLRRLICAVQAVA
jgi:hypothetical protein